MILNILNVINFFPFNFAFLVRNFYRYKFAVIIRIIRVLNLIDAIRLAEAWSVASVVAMVRLLVSMFGWMFNINLMG